MNDGVLKITIEVFKQALAYMLAPAFFIAIYELTLKNLLQISYEKPLPTFLTNIFTILFVVLYFLIWKKDFYKKLFIKSVTVKNFFLVTLVGIFSRLPLILALLVAISILGDSLVTLLDEGVQMQWEGLDEISGYEYYLNIISTSVLVPIHEEIFFRGVILTYLLTKAKPSRAIIISSLIFALFHFHPGLYLATFILGLMLGYTYYKLGNIWYAIWLHMLINIQPFIFEYWGIS